MYTNDVAAVFSCLFLKTINKQTKTMPINVLSPMTWSSASYYLFIFFCNAEVDKQQLTMASQMITEWYHGLTWCANILLKTQRRETRSCSCQVQWEKQSCHSVRHNSRWMLAKIILPQNLAKASKIPKFATRLKTDPVFFLLLLF